MATTREDCKIVVLQPSAQFTGDGDGSTFEVRGSRAVAYLDITDDDFTTLDVDIEAIDPAGNSYVIASFAQQSGVASIRLVTGVDPLLDHNIRASWDLTGTDATFSVYLVVKED